MNKWEYMLWLTKCGLPASARLILFALKMHDGNGGIFPTEETLAFETGLSRRSVRRWITWLRRKGYLLTKRTGRANRYTLRDITLTPTIGHNGLSDRPPRPPNTKENTKASNSMYSMRRSPPGFDEDCRQCDSSVKDSGTACAHHEKQYLSDPRNFFEGEGYSH